VVVNGPGAPPASNRPDAIKAIPVRHWGRWLSAAVVIFFVVALLVSFIKNPHVAWPTVRHYLFYGVVLKGLWVTIYMTLFAMLIGVVGGTLLAVMRLSKNAVLSTVSWVYIWFFRGTPVLVQILIWGNFGILFPHLFLGIPFIHVVFASVGTNRLVSATVAGILGLGINEAAYAAEIVRAGIISVDRGQGEAAESLGMSPGLTMRRIVLPQAMRVIIPPMGNEFISMLKTTSLVVVISGAELLTNVQLIYSQTFEQMPLLIVASFWYILVTTILTIGQHYVEAYFGRGFGEKETLQAELRAMKRIQRRDESGGF
jgi:polar amino acid transport system permease protein